MSASTRRTRTLCRTCGERCQVTPRRLAIYDTRNQLGDWRFGDVTLCPPCLSWLTDLLFPGEPEQLLDDLDVDGRMWPRRRARAERSPWQRLPA